MLEKFVALLLFKAAAAVFNGWNLKIQTCPYSRETNEMATTEEWCEDDFIVVGFDGIEEVG